MTLATLLRHHGVTVPKYVTIDGRIVVDGVQATPFGYRHPTLGGVSALTSHTFHGGDDPDDAGKPESPVPGWWNVTGALDRERTQMAIRFPGFKELAGDGCSPPAWYGQIDTGRGGFEVIVAHREDHGLPWVRVVAPRTLGRSMGRQFRRSPHLYSSGALCVASQDDWKPAEHTAVEVVAWAAHWLACYTAWRITTQWPVDGYRRAA